MGGRERKTERGRERQRGRETEKDEDRDGHYDSDNNSDDDDKNDITVSMIARDISHESTHTHLIFCRILHSRFSNRLYRLAQPPTRVCERKRGKRRERQTMRECMRRMH